MFRVEKTCFSMQGDHTLSSKRSVYKIEEVERQQDHGRGKPEPSGVVTVGL